MRTARLLSGAIVLTLAASSAHAALVARYNFEEAGATLSGAVSTTAGAVLDSTGSGRNGTVSGTNVTYAAGKVGSFALNLTGSGSVNLTSTSASIAQNVPAVSFTVWTKVSSLNTGNSAIAFISHGGAAGGSRAVLFIDGGGKPGLAVRETDAASVTVFSTASAVFGSNIGGNNTLNTWIHLAGTINYGTNTLALYVNGQPAGSTIAALGAGSTSQNTPSLGVAIGRNPTNTTEFFKGSLDDLRIYNHALTSAEVAAVVPEPASLGLLALSACLLVRRRA